MAEETRKPPILITADEVNCLIHAYFEDSGFQHSAFVLRAEGKLDHSPNIHRHVPRGELVYLLSKALLYTEVEAHWRGSFLTANCKAPFTLLDKHECSLDPTMTPAAPLHPPAVASVAPNGAVEKKRPSTLDVEEGVRHKRARTEDSMDLDSVTSAPQTKPSTPAPPIATEAPPAELQRRYAELQARDSSEQNAVTLLEKHNAEVFVCAWNPQVKGRLASGSKDCIVHLWDIHKAADDGPLVSDPPLTLAHQPHSESGDITSLDWNSEGSLLAVGSYDSILRVFTSTGELYFSREQHKGAIFAARFSKSGKWLLTASLDGSACVWDVPSKELYRQFKSHDSCCLDIDWVTEDMFVSCGADSKIHVMQLNANVPLKTLSGHGSEVNQVKYNAEKCLLASCSDDCTARIWAMDEFIHPGEESAMSSKLLSGHEAPVNSVFWKPSTSQDERAILATASSDHTCRLWDGTTGECLHVFNDHKLEMFALSWSPDTRYIATGSSDGWMHIYDSNTYERKWSWTAGNQAAIFEIDWGQRDDVNRLAVALHTSEVAIIDVSRISALR